MRKLGFGKRLLTLLLALLMVISPVQAATGDICYNGDYHADGTQGDYLGITGLDGNIDTADTISWPIKVYDYLNDGMLFEYSQSQATSVAVDQGSPYGGRTYMPSIGVGNDYTYNGVSGCAYWENAYYNWLSQNYAAPDTSVETTRTIAEPVEGVDPMYLHLEYPTQNSSRSKSWVWVSDFANDNDQYYSKEEIRYAVIVYRTNDVYAQTQAERNSDDLTYNNNTWGVGDIQFHWAVSDSARSADLTYHTGNSSNKLTDSSGNKLIDISSLGDSIVGTNSSGATKTASGGTMSAGAVSLPPSTDKWSYLVVDMCSGDIKNYFWNSTCTINGSVKDCIGDDRIAGVKVTIPINDQGEAMDISHIAYFSSQAEADNFGAAALRFNNDPGEYLLSTKITTSAGNAAPTVSGNGQDFTDANKFYSDIYYEWSGDGLTLTKESTDDGVSYVNISNTDSDNPDTSYIFKYSAGVTKTSVRYITIVYRTHGISSPNLGMWIESDESVDFGNYTSNLAGAGYQSSSYAASLAKLQVSMTASTSEWKYVRYDLNKIASADTDYNSFDSVANIGIYFPGFVSGQSLDIAFIDIFSDATKANDFGAAGAAYMNDPATTSTTSTRGWNTGNNTGFSMLYANSGGGWSSDTFAGGSNTKENGFFSYQIGKTYYKTTTDSTINSDRETAATKGYPVSNSIFLLNMYNFDELDTEVLDLGYTLYNHAAQGLEGGGVYTIGLLEAGLIDAKGVDDKTYKIPQYKEDSVGYIAYLLRDSLKIGQRDSSGNYNYNFVHGARNGAQFGYADTAKTQPYDLAEALRAQLDLKMPDSGDGNFTVDTTKRTEAQYLGSYADTLTKKDMLIGPFLKCMEALETAGKQLTCYDAAYYLLHNIFVDDSYNQLQDDYNYLVLSKGKISATGKEAYVFDGGFTTGTTGASITTDEQAKEYAQTSNSAVQYSPIVTTTDADGKTVTTGKGTIELSTAISKDVVWYDNDASRTTRFPFLPVTDPDENTPYADPMVVNMLDDGARSNTTSGNTYAGRNYNFVMQANGEFVYHYEDELFFEFQGDDDVYLFVNGQLIMDIGGAHSITTVSMNMNDYVDWARSIKADATAYAALTAAEKTRVDALTLKDGDSYAIDFYYMERHGWGSNMRVATNIVMTDPALQTNKTAYQSGAEIPYGGTVTKDEKIEYSFAMTNAGNNKLYRLSYVDNNLGVSLDSTNGLVVTGEHVTDANGGTLDPEDLVITVEGYYDEEKTQPTGTISIPIADTVVTNEDGTTTVTQTAEENLKKFLYDLQSGGTQAGEQDSSLFAGAGLWRHGTVTVRGIWYTMPSSVDVFDNTVFTNAHPSVTSDTVIKGEDTHRIRAVSNAVYFYQWAGHDLYIEEGTLIDALKDTMEDSSECSCTASNVLMLLSDGDNNVRTYDSITNTGSLLTVNYETPGTQTLTHVTLLQDSNNDGKADTDSSGAVIVKHTIPVVYHVTDVEDSTLVLDYGLKAELTASGGIYANDSVTIANSSTKVMGLTTADAAYLDGYTSTLYGYDDLNRISFTNAVGSDGKLAVQSGHDGQYSVDDGKLYFTPFDFMDSTYSVKAAVTVYNTKATPSAVGPANGKTNGSYSIDITKEVQMFQTVTVLPANVVYYEDDFAGISYYSDGGNFVHHTNEGYPDGSAELIQSVDQNIPYGQDPVYQTPEFFKKSENEETGEWEIVQDTDGNDVTFIDNQKSGNSLKEYSISDDSVFASFTFTGTGFEVISRTDAMYCGTMIVEIFEIDENGAKLQKDYNGDDKIDASDHFRILPVITEFDNKSTGNGGSEIIHQVPVIRVDGLDKATYIVEISGSPEYDSEAPRSNWVCSRGITQQQLDDLLHNENQYDGQVIADRLKQEWVQNSSIPFSEADYNAVCYPNADPKQKAYTIEERTQNLLDLLGEFLPPLSVNQNKLYIDGIRVYQPLGASHSAYRAEESGASFTEARQLLLDSQMAFINWQNTGKDILTCTGNIIWSENRNGVELNDGTLYTSTLVDSIEDYLVCGPNNELYFRRNGADTGTGVQNYQMLLFYVEEDDDAATTGSLQIGVRGIDYDLFTGSVKLGANGRGVKTQFRYVKDNGSTGEEKDISYVNSSTEQYYTIDYTSCPYTTNSNGKKVYTVMLLGRKADDSYMLSFTNLKHNGLTIKPISEVDTDLTNEQMMSGTSWYFDPNGLLVTPEGQTYGSAHFDLRQIAQTVRDLEAAREQATQKPTPDVQTAIPTPAVRQGMSKTLQLILLAAGTAVVLAGAWYLTRKYLHLL